MLWFSTYVVAQGKDFFGFYSQDSDLAQNDTKKVMIMGKTLSWILRKLL